MPLAPPPPLATPPLPPLPPFAPEAAGGVCACEPGWGGDGCADDLCVGLCGEHGMCVKDGNASSQADAGLRCACEAGWRGTKCEEDVCGGCSGQGACTATQTVGRMGAFAATYEGTTTRFACQCFAGWEGAACAQDTCGGCHGNGHCLHGSCTCHVGWRGVDCAEDTCPGAAADGPHCGGKGRGRCERGTCVCEAHRRGLGCELDTCPRSRAPEVYGLSCGGATRGLCAQGACFCKHGWAGEACAQPTCPQGLGEDAAPCAGHGRCVSGLCACGPGWVGVACDVLWRESPPPPPPPPPPSPPSPSVPRALRDVAPEFIPVVAPSLAAMFARAAARRRGRRDVATLFGELQPDTAAGARPPPYTARADVRRVPPPLDTVSTDSHASVGDVGLGLPGRPPVHPVRGWHALHELLQQQPDVESSRDR